jgi:hypothetical protein
MSDHLKQIQDVLKICIHIIIRNINLVYTSFWDTLYAGLYNWGQ